MLFHQKQLIPIKYSIVQGIILRRNIKLDEFSCQEPLACIQSITLSSRTCYLPPACASKCSPDQLCIAHFVFRIRRTV